MKNSLTQKGNKVMLKAQTNQNKELKKTQIVKQVINLIKIKRMTVKAHVTR